MPTRIDRPREPGTAPGRWLALSLALAVHMVFIAVLVFSIRWQNRQPDAVTAELYAPPIAARVAEPPVAPPPPRARPPTPEPAPAPPPAPVPAPVRKPEPVIEKPDPRAADIALKAKAEAERKKRVEAERELQEAQKREAENKRQDEQKRLAEARERQAREAEALKTQAARERQAREAEDLKTQAARERQTREAEALKAQAARERQVHEAEALKALVAREAQVRAEQQAAAAASERARADYIARITAKIKGNINEPGDIPGNPEAVFSVVQLPTGEIIEVNKVKSSGNRAYDDAVERAIRKSSPLPKPDRADLWTRTLRLNVRPHD